MPRLEGHGSTQIPDLESFKFWRERINKGRRLGEKRGQGSLGWVSTAVIRVALGTSEIHRETQQPAYA